MQSSNISNWGTPAGFGLMGFGMSAMLTGLHISGYAPGGANLALALIWGRIGQIIAGIISLRRGEFFVATTFMGYGSFWLSLYFLSTLAILNTPETGMIGFWLMWFLFSVPLTVAAPKRGKVLTIVFILVDLGFLLLAAVAAGATSLIYITGWEIFFIGLGAWYLATVTIINESYGKNIARINYFITYLLFFRTYIVALL